MSLVQCIDLGIEFAGDHILRGVNCTIEHNSRIGLIGANGSGKSTLIKLILGELRPSEGKVLTARQLKIAYLAQNAIIDPSLTLMKHIKSARKDIWDLKAQMESLSAQLHEGEDEAIERQLNRVIEKMHQMGAFEHENQIKYVLTSLGFPESIWEKRIGDFSGGEQTRICLAYLLLNQYDLLILDEPTNHLDLAMIRWLENYLIDNPKPFMVVSHDRVFLDKITRSIYAISNTGLSVTKGNYSSYYEARQVALKSQAREYERQQKYIQRTRAFIQKNIAGQKTNQAKSRLKTLQKMDLVDAPETDTAIRLQMQSADRSGNDVFRMKGVSFGIGEELLLAQKVDLEAHWQDRIAIIGPNGCGKSTLLHILMKQHPILKGDFYYGASLKIGYFDQHQNQLDESLTVMETLWAKVPDESRGYVLSWLARFGFRGDDVDKRVSVLSGGEKSRLYLSVLIHEKPNLLILDEPTNHLDIPMHDAFLEALQDFEGTIIFVSHDRYFIKQLASKFWVFTRYLDQDKIATTIQEPDLDVDAAIDLAFTEPELPKAKPEIRERKRKINPWHLEQIHDEITARTEAKERAEKRLEEIHKSMSDSATYANAERVRILSEEERSLQDQITEIQERISALEDEYLELACED